MLPKTKLIKLRKRRKALAIALLGSKCKSCGTTRQLEFDHINPNNVGARIATLLGGSFSKLLIELKKCQLLCHDCHWDKTRADRGLNKPNHGSASMYTNQKCRCRPCTVAWREYHRLGRYSIRYKANKRMRLTLQG